MSAAFLGLWFHTYNLVQDFEDHDFEPAKGQERAHLDPLILLKDQGDVDKSKNDSSPKKYQMFSEDSKKSFCISNRWCIII